MEFTRTDTKVIKGIAIVLMLYHHLFYFPNRIAQDIIYYPVIEIAGKSLAYYLGQFGKLCVAIFLFLGGYGTYISCKKCSNNADNIYEVICKKIKRLYGEYWKVFVVFIPICMLAGVSRVTKTVDSFVWNFLGLSISYCGEWWFLTPYVALLFTYTAGHRFVDKKTDLARDLFIILSIDTIARYVIPNIYGYEWSSTLNNSLFWNIFSQMLSNAPAFYMGAVCAKHDLLTRVLKKYSESIVAGIGALVVMLLLFCMRISTGGQYDMFYAPILTVCAIIFLREIPIRIPYIILEHIGNESTTIWLVHSIYCYLLCQKFVFFPRYTFLIFLLLLAMSFVTSILLKYLFRTIAAVFTKNK